MNDNFSTKGKSFGMLKCRQLGEILSEKETKNSHRQIYEGHISENKRQKLCVLPASSLFSGAREEYSVAS